MRPLTRILAALGCLAMATAPALAQNYPTRPIRMIVAFAPGGSADINARIVGQQLGVELGQQVFIENRGGAGGNLGAVEAKRAAPDGYTIFYTTSAVALSPATYPNPGFDPQKDFKPISTIATIPLVLVVNPKLPVATLPEFVAWAKAQKGQVNYGSSGRGALIHIVSAQFARETGFEATHVAYRGSAPAVTDLVGGAIQFMLLPANEAKPQIEGGALRPIAVPYPQRLPLLPDVPTFREAIGVATLDADAWSGLSVPPGTPPHIVARLTEALRKTLANEEVRRRITELGSVMLGGTDKEFADLIKQEQERWAKIVAETGVKAE
jgi:tripartite-type tricarboxylate transporter receptor subunit TctC